MCPARDFTTLIPARVSCNFDPAYPAVLLYAFLPGKTDLKLVALEYLIPFACMQPMGRPRKDLPATSTVGATTNRCPSGT